MKKPSVTQLIGLLDKPALLNWANQQGLKGIDIKQQRKLAMASGSALHKQIENFHKGVGDFDNIEDRDRFIEFSNQNEILEMELPVETEYFIGRVDCIMKRNGELFITDFKKGGSNVVYFEQKLQLVAYGMATGISNLSLTNIPDFVFRPVLLKDIDKYQEIIISLSRIWTLKKSLGL